MSCEYAGPGVGDCDHRVGLPGYSVPGLHDGPDDTVDAYGKPHGWCWFCWQSRQIEELRAEVERLEKENAKLRIVEEAAKLLKTDPNNDAYRFNLWQALKDKE